MISWYLDITPNEMFYLYDYPIQGKDGLPLCKVHGKKLEMLEVVVIDRDAIEFNPTDHCRKPSVYLRENGCAILQPFYYRVWAIR